jgi:hypothetical protein
MKRNDGGIKYIRTVPLHHMPKASVFRSGEEGSGGTAEVKCTCEVNPCSTFVDNGDI